MLNDDRATSRAALVHGRTGLLYPHGDIAALAAALTPPTPLSR
ncbi:MAG TPA: hypothetical protein VF710_15645 [Longimicrobium sp.]